MPTVTRSGYTATRTAEGWIPIPRPFHPDWLVKITRTDGTIDTIIDDAVLISWNDPVVEIGVGTFEIDLLNNNDKYTDLYADGNIVEIYCDNGGATTLRFKGRIESPKRAWGSYGSIVKLTGSSEIGFEILKKHITLSVNDTVYNSLKSIIDTYLTGFTYTNAENITTNIVVDWEDKPLLACLQDLCKLGNVDIYIDTSKDFHMFTKSSKYCVLDTIVWDDNIVTDSLAEALSYGTSGAEEVNVVRIRGEDDAGAPILWKTSTSGVVERENVVCDTDIKTLAQAQARADAELEPAPETGEVKCRNIFFCNPGELMKTVLLPGEQPLDKRVLDMKHTIQGDYTTNVIFSKQAKGLAQIFKDRILRENQLDKVINPNRLLYSFPLDFNDETNTLTHIHTELSNGKLVLMEGYNNGTFESITHSASADITRMEFRMVGTDLSSSVIYFSVDEGMSWEAVSATDALITPIGIGQNLKLRLKLVKDAENPNPQCDSLVCLYL